MKRLREGQASIRLSRFQDGLGNRWSVAIVRALGQGPNPAQSTTRDVIEDLDPSWLILTGIAGGVPTNDFTLGDVCIASRLHDFPSAQRSKADLPLISRPAGRCIVTLSDFWHGYRRLGKE